MTFTYFFSPSVDVVAVVSPALSPSARQCTHYTHTTFRVVSDETTARSGSTSGDRLLSATACKATSSLKSSLPHLLHSFCTFTWDEQLVRLSVLRIKFKIRDCAGFVQWKILFFVFVNYCCKWNTCCCLDTAASSQVFNTHALGYIDGDSSWRLLCEFQVFRVYF